MALQDLHKLLTIRAFRRDEKERLMMRARTALEQAVHEKAQCFQQMKTLAESLLNPFENLAQGQSVVTTGDIFDIRAEIAYRKQQIEDLKQELIRLEHVRQQREVDLHRAREAYMVVLKAYDRLDTLTEEMTVEENRMADIMEELNADDPILKKSRATLKNRLK